MAEIELPPPPPPVDQPLRQSLWWPMLIILGVFAAVFGRDWLAIAQSDWLAAGAGAVVIIVASILTEDRWLWRGWLATSLYLLMVLAFTRLGKSPSLLAAPIETLAVEAIAAAMGLAGLYLGFWNARPEKALACGLVLASAALWLLADMSLVEARRHAAGLAATGGYRRWAGMAAALAAYFVISRSRADL